MAENGNPHKPKPPTLWDEIREFFRTMAPMFKILGVCAVLLALVIGGGVWWTRRKTAHGELMNAVVAAHQLTVTKRVVRVYKSGPDGLGTRTDVFDLTDGHRISRDTTNGEPERAPLDFTLDHFELRVGDKPLVLHKQVDGKHVHISATTGDGKALWTASLDNRAIAGAWVVDNRIVLLMHGADESDDGEAVALDAADGHVVWHTAT